ncbi:hypothetical protein D3C81_1706520 [compost metagenome]
MAIDRTVARMVRKIVKPRERIMDISENTWVYASKLTSLGKKLTSPAIIGRLELKEIAII